MTVVRQGPFGGGEELPPGGNAVQRGIKRIYTTPSFSTAPYSRTYDAELMAKALKPYEKGTIGLVATYEISYAHVSYLKEALPKARFVEASDFVDGVRAIKSDEELRMIRQTAALQDEAMRAAFDTIRPGMRESDVAAAALHTSQLLGSEQGIYLCCSGPDGSQLRMQQRHYQNRVIEKGDQFILLVENNGPGGQYTELGRSCVLGPVPQKLADEFAFTLEARNFVIEQMTPGVAAAEVFERYCAFMRRNGRPEEKRLFAHNQGCDMVERPLIRQDETMTIELGMNFAIHPTYHHDGMMSWVCDNYVFDADGRLERIHAFPETIVEC
jgi:Xaa-Pro aminopeptidase